MDYIIRNNSTYIKRNENGAAITCSQQEAEKFEYNKAKNLLSSLPKSLKKFHFRLEAIPEITPPKKPDLKEKEDAPRKIIQEPKAIPESVMRWVNKVEDLNGLGKDASERLRTLNHELVHIEHVKQDILHEIELATKVNACDGYKKYRELKIILEKRREIKDEKLIVEAVLESNVGQLAANNIRKSVEGLKSRKYRYREQNQL